MISTFNKIKWSCWERVSRILAGTYIVGPDLKDAVTACRRLTTTGMGSIVCYWDAPGDAPEAIAAMHIKASEALHAAEADCVLSIKSPALRFDPQLHAQIAQHARSRGLALHFDSHAPETADETFAAIEGLLPLKATLGCTLPGRWRRSLADAAWAVERGLRVRVVKGQWADNTHPEGDSREMFLAVVDRLAGRACHVGVATHDGALAREALARLKKKNTPCELELLYGLPMKQARQAALDAGIGVRIYLPFGYGWVPYCASQVRKHPTILYWMLRDFLSVSLGLGSRS
ncbi:MAG: proline dehydrogenase [Elusimicrobiota bacterium]